MNDTGNKVFGFYQGHLRISEGRKLPQITKRNLYMNKFLTCCYETCAISFIIFQRQN